MELLDFINQNKDWEQILISAPYFLIIKKYENYIIFTIDQIHSDKTNLLVQQANGTIFKQEKEEQFICVNYGLPYIFNYKEDGAPNIDWSTVETYSHIDGLIIYFWYDNNQWHFTSNKEYNLQKILGNNGSFVYTILIEACNGDIKNITKSLSPNFCYTFILTSPNYQIVADYGNKSQLWFVLCRNLTTFKEERYDIDSDLVQNPHHFKYLRNPLILEQLQKTITKDEVGYMCIDQHCNRIYIDGEEYIRDKYIRGPIIMTFNYAIELWQKNQLEEYVQLFGNNPIIISTLNNIKTTLKNAEDIYKEIITSTKKDIEKFNRRLPRHLPVTSGFCVKKFYKEDTEVEDYFKQAPVENILIDLQYVFARRNK